MTDLYTTLHSAFPDLQFQQNFPLTSVTYFKIGGAAELYVKIADPTQLRSLRAFCQSHKIPFTMLGGGSNVIVSDAGVRGVVCTYTNADVAVISQNSEGTTVRVGVGIKTSLLVAKTVSLGLTGLEYFLGVPGTLGGAIYNNAHYLNELIGTHITQVEILDESLQSAWITQAECAFGYDSSRFHHTSEIILTADFLLQKGDALISQNRIKEATQYRASTQPLGPPSSGCIFRNAPNNPALQKLFPQFADKPFVPGGFLIDQAGLKGTRVGGVVVSEKHAAWLINEGNGTQKDVSALIEKIKTTVRDQFGVELQEEVFYLQ